MARPVKFDDKSIAGKELSVEEHTQVLVIGGGQAGLFAAINAAQKGLSVVLVDENPVPFSTMGAEVPLHYGQGMSGVARNRNAMTETMIASEPLIEAAFDAGVDVRLATACWGLYTNGPGSRWMPGTVAGVADEERGWLIGADHVIVATGRRDMGLGFPGWDKPGAMGATAALSLARFGALAPRRVVLLGTSAEALDAAKTLARAGVEIVAIIEQAVEPIGPAEMVEALRAAGCVILTGHVVREAVGSDAVEAVLVGALDQNGETAGQERRIESDGVVLAVGVTPVIDLIAALGAGVSFQQDRGGYAPVIDTDQRTSVRNVFAVGDCAGIWPAKTRDCTIAKREGLRAVAAILSDGGVFGDEVRVEAVLPDKITYDLSAYRLDWVRASVVAAREAFHVCQCEEVTAREILEVRPPRYLDWQSERRNDRSLSSLLGEGPPNPDQVKRLTRAGMGACQGRRCREQVAALLALQSATPLASIPLAGYRAPVRPLSLAVSSTVPEAADQGLHWDVWFGIHAQWRPYWEVPEFYTVATNDATAPAASE